MRSHASSLIILFTFAERVLIYLKHTIKQGKWQDFRLANRETHPTPLATPAPCHHSQRKLSSVHWGTTAPARLYSRSHDRCRCRFALLSRKTRFALYRRDCRKQSLYHQATTLPTRHVVSDRGT